MGSTRLPGKVLKELGGKKVLDHVVERLERSELIDKIIVATSVEEQDDEIVEWGKDKGVTIFRGSEQNVLKRFHDCLEQYPSDVLSRVTADCPLISHKLVDDCLKLLIDGDHEYVSMDLDDIPRQVHAVCLKKETLEEVYRKANKASHKEHVTYYIYDENGDDFKTAYLEPPEWLKRDYRLTLDTELDYKLLKEIFSKLYLDQEYLSIKKVIEFLDNNQEIAKINKSVNHKFVSENDPLKSKNSHKKDKINSE